VLCSARAELTHASAVVPVRRWYGPKRTLSFLDMLTSARNILCSGDLHALEAHARRVQRREAGSLHA
jgi:hypothetical protein